MVKRTIIRIMDLTSERCLIDLSEKIKSLIKTKRLPKPIINNESPQRNTVFATDDYYPEQETHYDIAEYLIPKIKKLLN